jgi:nucleoside phosphorylase
MNTECQKTISAHENNYFRCDVLILFATPSEYDMLKEAARELGIMFDKRCTVGPHGENVEYFSLGHVGNVRVNALRTAMGPFSYGGSASRAIYYRTITGATAIIQVGMAFGIDPLTQKLGDVLASTSLIPYDSREVRAVTMPPIERMIGESEEGCPPCPETEAADAGPRLQKRAARAVGNSDKYTVNYSRATRHAAKQSLVKMFEKAKESTTDEKRGYQVFFGDVLSGGARVFSRKFIRELVTGVPQAEDGVVGGEMEGVGLLSVSPMNDPLWCVVKGISDFGDENRDQVIKESRPVACKNSALFVLSALMKNRTAP